MHVTPISTLEGFADLASDWNGLAGGAPLRSWQWLAGWWRQYAPNRQLRVLAVFDAGELAAVAPLYSERSPVQGRVWRFLGSGEVCTDHATILCRLDQEEPVLDALIQYFAGPKLGGGWLATDSDDHWDLLELAGVDASNSLVARLVEQLSRHGCGVHRRPGQNCWRLELPESWEDYLATLSKSHRKQVRRVEQRLLGTGRAVLHTVREPTELPAAFEIFVDLHQRRRKSLGEPGCFASARFAAFLRETAEALLARGQLRLHWLQLDGVPVAAEFHMAGDGVVYGYQSGVAPEALEDEPGRIAAVATLQLAIADGYHAFDFMRGDEPYKAHWRAEPQTTVEYRVAAPRMTSRLRQTAWIAAQNVKQRLKAKG